MLAEKNIYNNSAYRRLQAISQDDGKRMEYEARQKAIRNYKLTLGLRSQYWGKRAEHGGHLLRRGLGTGGKNTECPNREGRHLHQGN